MTGVSCLFLFALFRLGRIGSISPHFALAGTPSFRFLSLWPKQAYFVYFRFGHIWVKTIWPELTHKRQLPGVTSHVPLQAVFVVEFLVAVRTT